MFFSIIIPAYNVSAYLEECIESVLNQSMDSYEIIIVNDGSTDKTKSILDKYNLYTNVKVIHQLNQGVSVARNVALKNSNGKYILFLDGDDFLLDNHVLQTLFKKVEELKNPDFIYNNMVTTVRNDGSLKKKTFDYNPSIPLNKVSHEKALDSWLTSSSDYPWSIWGNIYKRDCIIDNSLYFKKDITLGEDADWLFRFILCSSSNATMNDGFYCYRVDRIGSAMNIQTSKNLISYLKIINQWIQYAENIDSNSLSSTIKSRLIDNYYLYLKYIYFLNSSEISLIITEIKYSDLFSYSDSLRIKAVNFLINRIGYNPVLKFLNSIFKLKLTLKKEVKKFIHFVKHGFVKRNL